MNTASLTTKARERIRQTILFSHSIILFSSARSDYILIRLRLQKFTYNNDVSSFSAAPPTHSIPTTNHVFSSYGYSSLRRWFGDRYVPSLLPIVSPTPTQKACNSHPTASSYVLPTSYSTRPSPAGISHSKTPPRPTHQVPWSSTSTNGGQCRYNKGSGGGGEGSREIF
jgi:hypothetical protein